MKSSRRYRSWGKSARDSLRSAAAEQRRTRILAGFRWLPGCLAQVRPACLSWLEPARAGRRANGCTVLGACPRIRRGRVPGAEGADARRRDAGDVRVHRRGAPTPQMPPRRPEPEGRMGVVGDLFVARRRRCASTSPSSSHLELASQAPCARPLLILGQAPSKVGLAMPPDV